MSSLLSSASGGLSLNFTSDNAAGASIAIQEAVARSNSGFVAPYGGDDLTVRVERKLCDVFERDVSVLLVPTGTAANSLCLASLTLPWQSVLCQRDSHINTDECGAPEFFTGGAKLVGIGGPGAKLDMNALSVEAARKVGDIHAVQPRTVSITQATEMGEVYSVAEVEAIGHLCKAHGLRLHMDGSRFANALVSLGCTPAELTWKAGVDALSFGATKNGAMCAEAVVLFDPEVRRELAFRRKRAGHLLSKMRFLAAQFDAYLANDLWLDNARHANTMARRLAERIRDADCVEILGKPDANIVFCRLPDRVIEGLSHDGVGFIPHRWGLGVARFVTSFMTQVEAIDWLSARIGQLSRGAGQTLCIS